MGRRVDTRLAAGLGAVARAARTHAGLTQADVAELVNLAPEVYGRLERGKMLPSVPTLRRLCVSLGISADLLLGLGGKPLQVAERPIHYHPSADLRRVERQVQKLDRRQLRLLAMLMGQLKSRG